MSLVPLSLNLRSNPARFGHAGAARLINCYAEETGNEAKNKYMIVGCDGLDDFVTLTDGGGIRAMLALTDADLYTVSGRLLFRADQSGGQSTLGGIPSDGLVTMARNRAGTPQIAVVCDGLYFKVAGGVLSQMADPDLPPPTSVAFSSGFFVFQLADGRMFASELDDTNVLPTDFATANSNPDGGMRVFTRGEDLISFGTRSVEFWRDEGGEAFPFGKTTSREVGLLAAGAVATVNETVAFVAHDGTVRMLQGYDAQRISHHAVERAIADDPSPSAITACSWQSRGHTFLSLSGTAWTWEYNATTGMWHERKSYASDRWRVSQAVQFGNRRVLGDYATGKLYTLNADAVASTALTEQQLMVDWSDDGGANFSSQRMITIGAVGERQRRVRTNRLGVAMSRTYRLSLAVAADAGDHAIMTVQMPPVTAYPNRMVHSALYVDVVPGLGPQANGRAILSAFVDADKVAA